MSTPIRTPAPVTVTGLPAGLVGLRVDQVDESVGPQPDQIRLSLPLGRVVRPDGTTADQYPTIPLRSALTVAADGWSVAADVVQTWERWTAPGQGTLSILASGSSLRLEHSYPTRIAGRDLPIFNGLGGFRGALTGPEGTATITSRGPRWTQAEVLRALIANAVAAGDLPPTTVTIPAGLLTGTPLMDLRGQSLLACLQALIGGRTLAWTLRPAGAGLALVLVDPAAAGSTLDLRGPWTASIEYGADGSATVAALDVMGGDLRTVLALDHYPASTGGELSEVSSSDSAITLRIAGGLLADGAPASAGVLQGAIPVGPSGMTAGDVDTSSYRVFVQGRREADAWDLRWAAEPVQVVAGGPTQLTLSGADLGERLHATVPVSTPPNPATDGKPQIERLRVVVCLASPNKLRAAYDGGPGRGRARRDDGDGRIVVTAGTPWGVTSGGSLTTLDHLTAGTTAAELETRYGPEWARVSSDRQPVSWTEVGRHGGALAPGAVVSQVILPGPTAAGRTLPAQGVVLGRSTTWDPSGSPQVRLTLGWPSVAGSL